MIIFIIYFIIVQNRTSHFINADQIKGLVYDKKDYETYTLVKVRTLFEKVNIYYYGEKKINVGDVCVFSNIKVNSLTKDYQNYLKSQGILQVYSAYDSTQIGRAFSPRLLNGYILSFYQTKLSEKSYNYISSLIFSKSEFDRSFKDSINNLGISYLFCISGYHIQIIAYSLEKILNKFIKQKYKIDILISMFLVFYSIICQFSAGISRATIMFILAKISFYKQYNLTKLDTISISFILMLILNPMCVYSMSFKLSYLITLFIILGSEVIKSKSKILSNYKISILSFISGLPFIIGLNYKINLLTILISPIFLVVFTYVIMPMTYILVFLQFLSPVFDQMFSLFENIILNIDDIKIFTINIRPFNALVYIIYYFCLYKFLVSYEEKNIKYVNLLYMTLLLMFLKVSVLLDPYDKIIMLDVSQGDSILIKKAHNKGNILIDSYGNNIEKLKSYGIDKIDALIITHSDYDHMSTAKDIIAEFDTNILVTSYYDNSIEINELRDMVGINYELKSNDSLKFKGIDFFFYGPVNQSRNKNDISLVFEVTINHFEMLFTGDMELELEQDIIDNFKKIDTDVLKVPHHGSNTSLSSYFMDNIKFNEALISVGINNHYGHPNVQTLNNLVNHKIYRTDKDGDIIIIISNNSYKISKKARFNLFYN